MSKVTVPVYRCDAPGCKSTCTLDPTEPAPDKALTVRGWTVGVGTTAAEPDKHYCPAHGSRPAPGK